MKLAPWIWKKRDAEQPLHLTRRHIEVIRRLKVGFEEVENGAASVELPEDVEPLPDLDRAIDLFLNHAELSSFVGRVHNPYVAGDADLDLLEDTPDAEVRARFTSGEDFDVEPTDAELAAFAEANLGSEGIDPKRPFGSERVARDLRPILDPKRTLGRGEFRRARARLESRMMVLLQFFVQNAELPLGVYVRDEYASWALQGNREPEPEVLDIDGWWERIGGDFILQNRWFDQTLGHLRPLVWHGRIDEPYATMVERYRLHDLYDDFSEPTWDGTTLQHALAASEAFLQHGYRIFALVAVRALNASARFTEALELLVKADRADPPADIADLKSPSYPNIGMLEAGIARYGAGLMDDAGFEAWLVGMHPSNAGRSPYPWVADVLEMNDLSQIDDWPLWWHTRAVCAQVVLMRGPFRPDPD